ncbi:hypothetical protein VPNG_08539 [Cytospora leucostoma]|uniref:FAD-binding PCMH-type domain-containing protein n=1 Tax=Cytospora leucostoma TaxID=1230097 RepID=A0A423W5B0_9PEZI|nr:hypothetical protein VPNG_08539 [Cytospora leucostoma]
MHSASAVALGASLFGAVTAVPSQSPYSVFTNSSNEWDPQTKFGFPNTTAFTEATTRWNTLIDPSYSIAITPATEDDVVKALKIARSIDLPFLATGGRHSSSITLDQVENGLAIDLTGLDSVDVDSDAATVTIGGGVRFRDILDPVYQAGFQTPVGSCACPGMVGATIGGGIGRYQGLHGLIIDNLLSVRLVTAEGDLIDVSGDSNSDLFWAVRGAAANFGIITSATYQLHPLVNGGDVLSADFVLPASSNASYFDLIEALQDNIPAELATISIVAYNDTADEAQILVNWVYIGPEAEGRLAIAPILDLNPVHQNISVVPYNKLLESAAYGLGSSDCASTPNKGYGVNFRNLSSSTYQSAFQTLNDFYAEHPGGRGSSLELEIFAPQGVQAVAKDATPYPWRDTLGYAGISFTFETAEAEKAGDTSAEQIRSALAATSGYDGLAVYVSYAHGDETLEQYYGDNLQRLIELKSQWDPDSVFRFYHPLPTSTTA